MISRLLVVLVVPLFCSLVLTPWVIRFAHVIGALDQPNHRKVHKEPIARLGGLAIFVSFALTLFLTHLLFPEVGESTGILPFKLMILLASLVLVLILGIFDDIYSLHPIQKVIVQVIAASMIYAAGFRISAITHPFSSGLLELGIFDYPATILWIIGITNAINLIDGLDGLASGVSIIAALTIFAISLLAGDLVTASVVLILVGSLLGFLPYNFNPAKIFLGDSGSLFIGFTLSVLSIESSTKGSTAIAILAPILALGLPIMDTLLSMVRRFLKSVSFSRADGTQTGPFSSIFVPDREHIHHRLIARGISHRNVVLLLYLVSCFFGIGAFAVTLTNNFGASIVLFVVAIVAFVGVHQLRYREMAVLRNGALLPLYSHPLAHTRSFQALIDMVFVVLSFIGAYSLQADPATLAEKPLTAFVVVACVVQSATLFMTGMYRSSLFYLGIGDIIQAIKSVFLATLSLAAAFMLFPQARSLVNVPLMMFDFYILISLVLGARMSYQVLRYVFRRESTSGKKVLIYGADADGILTLQRILNDDELDVTPIGFLDDRPEVEGKQINGYPVFGGHWKLERILRKHEIAEIFISSDIALTEVAKRLKRLARIHKIALRQFHTRLESVSVDRQPGPKPSVDTATAPRFSPGHLTSLAPE